MNLKVILNYLAISFLAFLMIFGAFNHVVNPKFYNAFIPDYFSKLFINYLTAIVELFIGVLILLPRWRRLGALLFIALMLVFFPIHIWDLCKESPAIGSKTLGFIRIIIQFFFIGISYFVFKRSSKSLSQ